MSKASNRLGIKMPTAEENKKILRAARADPDAQPLTLKQLRAMVPVASLRGRPKLENPKQLVSVRYSPEVLSYFRATGAGWQSRMDEILKAYVHRKSARG